MHTRPLRWGGVQWWDRTRKRMRSSRKVCAIESMHVALCFVYVCMGVWVHGCMGAWVYGCMGAWVHGCMGAWVYGCMGLTLTPTLTLNLTLTPHKAEH